MKFVKDVLPQHKALHCNKRKVPLQLPALCLHPAIFLEFVICAYFFAKFLYLYFHIHFDSC